VYGGLDLREQLGAFLCCGRGRMSSVKEHVGLCVLDFACMLFSDTTVVVLEPAALGVVARIGHVVPAADAAAVVDDGIEVVLGLLRFGGSGRALLAVRLQAEVVEREVDGRVDFGGKVRVVAESLEVDAEDFGHLRQSERLGAVGERFAVFALVLLRPNEFLGSEKVGQAILQFHRGA